MSAVLGAREREKFALDKRHLIPFLYRFHFTLHAGSVGEWIMGIVALVWFLDCFVGAYLTFPRGRPFFPKWVPAWKVKTGAGAYRVNSDLHEPFKAVVAWFSPLTPWYEEVAPKLPTPLETPTLTFEEAVDIATRARLGDQFNSWCIDSKTNLGCVRVAS